MSRNLSTRTVETSLPETLEHRLKSYSIAAAAAGVSMLALAQAAEAEVVITHKVIPVTGTVSIDINHDGISDFQLRTGYGMDGYEFFATASVKPLASGGVVGGAISGLRHSYAAALKRDVMIGRFKHFVSNKAAIIERFSGSCKTYCGSAYYGNWGGNPQNRYLGVKFLIDGEIHYGWIRLKVATVTAVDIESYAYETVANTPICAREVLPCPTPPADSEEIGQNVSSGPSLGMLALGTDGLALWRREALAF